MGNVLLKTVFLGTNFKTCNPVCGILLLEYAVHALLANIGEYLKHWTYIELHI